MAKMRVSSPQDDPKADTRAFREEIGSPTAAVREYQRRLLIRMFLLFLAAGVPWLLYTAWLWRGHWLMWVYIGLALYIVLLLGMASRLPYLARVIAGLLVLYIMAYLNGFVFKNEVQSVLWTVAAIFFGAVFLPLRAGLFNTLFAVATGGGMLYVELENVYPPRFPLGSGEKWGMTVAALTILAFVLQGMLSLYRRRLETALEEGFTLTQILEEERRRLEEQGEMMAHRVQQIRTVAEVAQSLSEVMDPEEMLWTFVERMQEAFDLYYVGVFLVEPEREVARLVAGSGKAGRHMVEEGYRLPLGGGSMIAWAIAHRQVRVAEDVREDPTYFPNPYLPETRSEGAFPLIARGEVLGALTVQSKQPHAFDEETINIFRMLADRLAIAYANARLFQDLQTTARRLEALQRQLTATVWETGWEGQTLTITAGETETPHGEHIFRMPLILHSVQVGEMTLYRDRPWQEEERTLLQKIVYHYLISLYATLMLRQARIAEQTRTLQRRFEEQLGHYLDIQDVIEAGLRFLVETFRAEDVRLVFTFNGKYPQEEISPEHDRRTRGEQP